MLQLHTIAKANGVAHTLAVGIPPSKLQEEERLAKEMAFHVDMRLWAEARATDDMTFVPFPFDYDGPNSKYWSKDGVHPTCLGYEALGEALAEPVLKILDPNVE